MIYYANDFYEISEALSNNVSLKDRMVLLIENEPIVGQATDGGNRLEVFRNILLKLASGDIELQQAIQETLAHLPRAASPHAKNNRVFSRRWSERLIRTQFSRFYNQAVLEELREEGIEKCFVPQSSHEEASSKCTKQLAGREQSVDVLYLRLIENYAEGNWSQLPKIPNHPHCTHVVKPIED